MQSFPRRRATAGRGVHHLPSPQSIAAIVDAETEAIGLILDLLDRTGISQGDLARLIGVTPPAVNQLVTGSQPTTLRRLVEIADVLGYKLHLEVRAKSLAGTTPAARGLVGGDEDATQ